MLLAAGESLFKAIVTWERDPGATHWALGCQTQVHVTVRRRNRDSRGQQTFGGHLTCPADRAGSPGCQAAGQSAWMLHSQAWGSQSGTSACSVQPESLPVPCVTNPCDRNEPPVSPKMLFVVSSISSHSEAMYWGQCMQATRELWERCVSVFPVSHETVYVAHISDPHPSGNVYFQHFLAPDGLGCPQTLGNGNVTVLSPLVGSSGEPSAAAVCSPKQPN